MFQYWIQCPNLKSFFGSKVKKGVEFIHESIIGSQFTGGIVDYTKVGDFDAIIPFIEGWAKITGENTITIDEKDDPFAFGFSLT